MTKTQTRSTQASRTAHVDGLFIGAAMTALSSALWAYAGVVRQLKMAQNEGPHHTKLRQGLGAVVADCADASDLLAQVLHDIEALRFTNQTQRADSEAHIQTLVSELNAAQQMLQTLAADAAGSDSHASRQKETEKAMIAHIASIEQCHAAILQECMRKIALHQEDLRASEAQHMRAKHEASQLQAELRSAQDVALTSQRHISELEEQVHVMFQKMHQVQNALHSQQRAAAVPAHAQQPSQDDHDTQLQLTQTEETLRQLEQFLQQLFSEMHRQKNAMAHMSGSILQLRGTLDYAHTRDARHTKDLMAAYTAYNHITDTVCILRHAIDRTVADTHRVISETHAETQANLAIRRELNKLEQTVQNVYSMVHALSQRADTTLVGTDPRTLSFAYAPGSGPWLQALPMLAPNAQSKQFPRDTSRSLLPESQNTRHLFHDAHEDHMDQLSQQLGSRLQLLHDG
jgi:hypothetical protein